MGVTDWAAVLLDLLNTTPVIDGQQQDLLGTDRDARRWLTAHAGAGVDPATARQLRDELQAVVGSGADPAVLGGYLAGLIRLPRLDESGVHWEMTSEPDWTARIVLAWADIAQMHPGRLRACGNPECRLYLLDRTRAGTARWCSMSVCGNRMKARRHYSRRQ